VALLDGGSSYGTIWCGGAVDPVFNVAQYRLVSADRLRLMRPSATLARVAARMALELAVGVWDFQRWCRRVGTTRYEWRFLYMRLFVSVIMRELATELALADVQRGVPRIFVDYLGYDEYAHRRGPYSELALYNLRGIDAAIGRLRCAVAAPQRGYDLYVISDHGQSATTPFAWVSGRDLRAFVLEHAQPGEGARRLEAQAIAELVNLRAADLWVRSLWRPLRPAARGYFGWLRRRLEARLEGGWPSALDGVEVVTGGSVAHLYFGARPKSWTVEAIGARFPRLLPALRASPAVGLIVGRSARGPVVFYRGRHHVLADRAALSRLEPFRRLGVDALRRLLLQASRGPRHGDLVLYGAFAEAGEVTFDFEFGSHGGVGADELEQFVVSPPGVEPPLEGEQPAEAFYRFFATRYGDSRAR
jgi:hypothetical protein